MKGVSLAHLASANPESANLLAPGCRLSVDWREAASDRTLDGIILATPPATHLAMALVAIESGIPVLVEKPMTLSVKDARTLVDRARQSDVLVMVGHTHLFSSAFRQLKSRASSLGSLQSTRSVGSNWGPFRPDASVLWDWGPHDVAMCIDLFRTPPLSVEAKRAAVVKSGESTGEAIEITLGFDAGARAEVRVSNVDERKRRCFEATYSGGTLVYNDLAHDKLVFRRTPSSPAEAVPLDDSLPLTNVVSEFCGCIASGEDPSGSLDLGLQVVQILADCEVKLESASVRPAA
jgi:predicted dehydrogenase